MDTVCFTSTSRIRSAAAIICQIRTNVKKNRQMSSCAAYNSQALCHRNLNIFLGESSQLLSTSRNVSEKQEISDHTREQGCKNISSNRCVHTLSELTAVFVCVRIAGGVSCQSELSIETNEVLRLKQVAYTSVHLSQLWSDSRNILCKYKHFHILVG